MLVSFLALGSVSVHAQQERASDISSAEVASGKTQVAFDPALDEWPQSISDLRPDPRLKFGRLDNGLRYIILPVADQQGRLSMRLQFSVGARDETEDQYGIAHFVEHMSFRGFKNAKYQEMAKTLQRMGVAYGAGLNAFTNHNTTIYHFDFPSDEARNAQTGLSLFNEIARGMAMDADAFEAERGVIVAEYGVRDTPQARAKRSELAFLYPDVERYKYPVGGSLDTIQSLTIQQLRQFYKTHYRPDNAIIVIAGNVDVKGIERTIVRKFGDWSAVPSDITMPITGVENPKKALRLSKKITGQFTSYHEANLASKMVTVTDLPFTLIGDSQLYQKQLFARNASMNMWNLRMRPETLRNKKLTWVNLTYNSPIKRDQARITIGAANYYKALTYIDTERRRALEHGFVQWELDRILQTLRQKLVDKVNAADKINARVQAHSLITQFNQGNVLQSPSQKLAQFDKFATQLSMEDYQNEFALMWSNDAMRLWIQSGKDYTDDQGKFYEGLKKARKAKLSAFKKPKPVDFKLSGLSAPGKIRSRVHNDKYGNKYEFEQLVFDNGVRLNIKKTNFKPDQVAVKINLGIGFRELSEINPDLRHLVKALKVADHKTYSREQLTQYFEGKKIGFSISVNDDRLLLYNNNLTNADLKAFFENMTSFLQGVNFESKYYAKYATRDNNSVMRRLNARPLNKNRAFMNHALYPEAVQFPAPHRIKFTSKLKKQLKKHVKPYLQSGPIEIGIAGDFDEKKLLSILRNTVGALPARDEHFTPYAPPAADLELTEEKLYEVGYYTKGDQAAFHYCSPFNRPYSLTEYERIRLLQEITAIKTNAAARERLGKVYSPNTRLQFSGLYKNYGFLCVGAQTSAEEYSDVQSTIIKVRRDMFEGNISDDEFIRAQKPFLARVINDNESNSVLSYQLARAQSKPKGLGEFFTREKRAKTVKLAQLKKIASEIFTSDSTVIISTKNTQTAEKIKFTHTKRIAKAGDVDAQLELAEHYLEGDNWLADDKVVFPAKAIKWLEEAAAQNSIEAHYKLALLYGNGKHVPIDLQKQRTHLKAAAETGHAKAQFRLADLYINNFKTFPGIENAVIIDLLTKSAQQGDIEGQRGLSRRLIDGAMIPRDEVQALVWLLVADKMSNVPAESWQTKSFKKKVSKATIKAAEIKAEEWVAEYYGRP